MKNNKDAVDFFAQKIVNRVMFHAPIVHDSSIDFKILSNAGIDPQKPIFLFEKPLTKRIVRAFCISSKQTEFNLLVPFSSVKNVSHRVLSKLQNLVLFSPESCSISLFKTVNKLNINYPAATNYDIKFSEKFFKINGEVVNAKFDDFSLSKALTIGKLSIDFHEFVLNGSNYFLEIHNFDKKPHSLEIELNIPLKRGYYFFKRLQKSVRIENLLTGEISYFNFNAHGAKFRFSQVDGLENSTFACLNLRAKINIKTCEFLFFNFGSDSFSLKNLKTAKSFYDLSRKKCYEIFDVQVRSKNPKFDQFFNVTLPRKIWLGWLDAKPNLMLEEKYIMLKKLFVKSGERLDFQRFSELGVREIGIFNGEYYKKILVVDGAEKFFRIGRTYFYNTNAVTKKSLETHEPISICFGQR